MLHGTTVFTFQLALKKKKIYKACIWKTWNESLTHEEWEARPQSKWGTCLRSPFPHSYTQSHSKSNQLQLRNSATSHHLVQAIVIFCLNNGSSLVLGLPASIPCSQSPFSHGSQKVSSQCKSPHLSWALQKFLLQNSYHKESLRPIVSWPEGTLQPHLEQIFLFPLLPTWQA